MERVALEAVATRRARSRRESEGKRATGCRVQPQSPAPMRSRSGDLGTTCRPLMRPRVEMERGPYGFALEMPGLLAHRDDIT